MLPGFAAPEGTVPRGQRRCGEPPAAGTNLGFEEKLLVEMLEPYRAWVYDPCCGSVSMPVQSEAPVDAHGGLLKRAR